MTDNITLPRSVVEQAMKLLDALSYNENYDYDGCFQHWADYARTETLASQFRAALEQPQDHLEQHLDMVPAGWKLVPVEPTENMLNAVAWPGCAATDWEHMLAAAPQPPVVKESGWPKLDKPARVGGGTFGMGTSARHVVMAAQRAHDEHVRTGELTHEQMVGEERNRRVPWDLIHGPIDTAPQPQVVEQPQAEQEPVAWQGRDGYLYHFIEEPKPGDRPLYTHPQNLNCKSTQARLATLWGYEQSQPPRQPLTDEQIRAMWCQFAPVIGGPLDFARAIERAHGIGGEA